MRYFGPLRTLSPTMSSRCALCCEAEAAEFTGNTAAVSLGAVLGDSVDEYGGVVARHVS